MSLAQHLTATEGIDREPIEHDHWEGPRLAKKLSYDVLSIRSHQPVLPGIDDDKDDQPQAVGAFEVSAHQRLAQVAFGVLTCVLASGVTFGFAALKPILVEAGAYRELCDKAAPSALAIGDACYSQDLRLNLVFTISTVVTNVSTLPVGTFFDRYGPRAATLVGCVALTAGCLLMAFATRPSPIDLLTPGYALLALGGSFIFVPSFHLANAFPKSSGLILALVTGAFDASAAVPLVLKFIHINLEQFFLAFLAVPAVIVVAQLTFMPAHSYKTVAELNVGLEQARDPTQDVHSSDDEVESEATLERLRKIRWAERHAEEEQIIDVLGDRKERKARLQREQDIRKTSGVWGAKHGLSAREQMASPWFVLITLFTVVQMIRMTFLISTLRGQYEYMLGSAVKADLVNDLFDLALPVGGIVAVPLIGAILDHLSTQEVLGLLVSLTTAVGLVGTIPKLWAGYVNVVLFVVLRPFYYSAMSDYATKVFGFATFGRVYGSIICISGLCSFAQSGLDALTHLVFDSNPVPVNLAMTALNLAIGIALTLFVVIRGRQVMIRHAKEEAAGATQGLLAGAAPLDTVLEDEPFE